MAFKTVKGSGMTNDLTGTSFKRGNGDPGYRISTRGFTSIFSGFSEDGSHGVVVDAPVSIEDLRAALDAAEAEGVTSVSVRISGRLEKARVVSEDKVARKVASLVLEDEDIEEEPAAPATPPTT